MPVGWGFGEVDETKESIDVGASAALEGSLIHVSKKTPQREVLRRQGITAEVGRGAVPTERLMYTSLPVATSKAKV